jgi:hypothetical protein
VSDTSRGPRLWRKFRSLPTRWQVASWIGLAVLVIVGAVVGGENSSGTATTAVTQTPTTATPESPASSPTPTATSTISLDEWRADHGTNITLVIATANGLVSAIDKADETAITRSCDALKNNYKNLLRPIPAPPGPLGETSGTWDGALDNIYNAQRQCSGGLISNPDLHKAQTEARDGAAMLHEVLGPAG